jgi:hypothetical protein
MSMFVKELGRSCEIVNLDFANDVLPYRPAVDVRDLISLQVYLNHCSSTCRGVAYALPAQDTMEEHKLGPNGGLLYCMEYLLENIEWLEEQIKELKTNYIIFDCPGQVPRHFLSDSSVLWFTWVCFNYCRLSFTHITLDSRRSWTS